MLKEYERDNNIDVVRELVDLLVDQALKGDEYSINQLFRYTQNKTKPVLQPPNINAVLLPTDPVERCDLFIELAIKGEISVDHLTPLINALRVRQEIFYLTEVEPRIEKLEELADNDKSYEQYLN